ncbi:hypothetical protein FGSG_04816 [Fusarium graminearum PH-1]|uniref:Chromosome 3, complete genome n=1 Tax=Gibberella zeae (strain ATCC MYA-4620 / CBS 123657 / FGSC 9075 / NRRL 31084 / PH-1) TaxID=229533 RepID=I1RLL1_GIBZE|nr:hypothetical protein FGSG_04816 [Fusarium graminearum PH-1]EYB27096.1 hypothetical protein FG05_04816 [Fusarium graminearum]ESU10690.1 hypothetical protein FGSG_04816 [Fusarium graminearum PH-1]KAI6758060.1 hypothetical protein HG531_003885 [Fusarium graminearum]PCD34056.1 hypothetical protein FGRA07_09211 [Fusarium graminearum]CAG1996759.1 unnamed protein product [Fusarium graminearum]|eukprot:XP_011323266.1 hypothetical protein FGSG_04816 [Fusarium graminearum PH-1]
MRFVSFATVLGAALLPAVNARPACRPDTSATSGVSATSVATTTAAAVETSSTEAATTVDASTTYETTTALETTVVVSATDETTTALETTVAISETATSDSTALIPTTTAETPAETTTAETTVAEIVTNSAETTIAEIATTTAETTLAEITTTTAETTAVEIVTTAAETTPAEIATTTAETTPAEVVTTTTEAATTTTAEAAGPTNFVKNGGFEDNTSNAWTLLNSDIANNPGNAHTGGQYLEFYVNNDFANGQNQASQTISGLSTDRQYGFSFYASVFGTPEPVIIPSTLCHIQARQGGAVIAQFPLDLNSVDYYDIYKVNFTPLSSDIDLSLRLRCTNGRRVTLALGIDDVAIGDVF